MKLAHLIPAWPGNPPQDPAVLESEISAVTLDSREAGPGSLFVAIQGNARDGHAFIGQALEKGATAVLAQRIPQDLDKTFHARIILAPDTRKAAAQVAARFYGHPSRDMVVVGITGTNGKTTTTWILESIFRTAGFNVGVMGTVNIRYAGNTQDNPVTTPDAMVVQKTLADMKAAGVTHVVMEVSSHGLAQYRVDGCEFDAGIFTNLTQDHLDYHETMDDYFQCKQRFFTEFLGQAAHCKKGYAVLNIDHESGDILAREHKGPVLTVSHSRPAHVRAKDVADDITGLCGTLCFNTHELNFSSCLTGRFNLENILCASGAALCLGIAPKTIIQGIASLDRVPGRLEKLPTALHRHIFVDYAHTPDALASILTTLSKRAPARLITVFGCGGDRDRTKRGPMGRIACQYSDIAIVTSDNPRTEDPNAIVDEIILGIQEAGFRQLDPRDLLSSDPLQAQAGLKGFIREVDRKKALALAVMISRPSDIIVAAGKGHETYQVTAAGTIHFDDKEELSLACKTFMSRFTPMPWSVPDLAEALSAAPVWAPDTHAPIFSAVSTDSRSIPPQALFLALEGDHFDGHTFIPQVLDMGIKGVIARTGFFRDPANQAAADKIKTEGIVLFETDNTLAALGELARYQRIRSGVKVLAITGSCGKTTTRKMAADIFATQFHTLATRGNLNNEIGVPMTLLNLSAAHEWAVIEMGMNHAGEISRLSRIAEPDIAVVTNTAGVHLEGLGTADNVARAKSEIFESVRENGTAIIFGDDPRQAILARHARANPAIQQQWSFGERQQASDACPHTITADTVQTLAAHTRFRVSTSNTDLADLASQVYTIATPARFMVNNSLAAIAAAAAAGIKAGHIRRGLAQFAPVQGRMTITRLSNGVNLIDDTYNANPAAMELALDTLARVARECTAVAILGDMLELGENAPVLHRELGHALARVSQKIHLRVCLFGKETAHTMAGAIEKGFAKERIFAGTKEAIAQEAVACTRKGDWILVKGSRGMAMETLIPAMERLIQGQDPEPGTQARTGHTC